ncbi:hypothetical protein [Roseovarius sp. ZX-A-9]|nr:hypothetical protein [Roseovarius sp. ZX-A-9]
MKAFLAALVALVVITVGANQILMRSGFSAEAVATSPDNVRLYD